MARSLFPHIEPPEAGMLGVGAGQEIYWVASGNRAGVPAVLLHGGPGSGSGAASRRLFDPEKYWIIQFDQRGCGHSRPRVDWNTDLSSNQMSYLAADMELLRQHLSVDRWVVWGVSWGVTLGLLYAETYPDRVIAAVFNSVTMSRPREIQWLYHDVGRFYPEAWRRFQSGVPEAEREGDLVAAYHRLLHHDPDPAVRARAARDWCTWEDAASPLPDGRPNPRYDDPRFRMTFARIVTHYFRHGAWLEQDQLLRNAARLAGIPAVLVHGRLDMGGPLDTAWELARAWPDAELRVVETGHAGGQEMTDATLDATDRFARLR
jgi:proline iminopeptidase